MAAILIVDDEFSLAELVGEVLAMRGHTATVAINGLQGLDLVKSAPFDLVICDVMMPVMTGPEMIAAMQSEARLAALPVLLISAEPKLLASLAAEPGVAATLPKPFAPKALYAAVDRLLVKDR